MGTQGKIGTNLRHKQSLRMPQPLSYAQAKICRHDIIEEFFDRLSALYTCTKYEFPPSQIYNADETGMSCVHKPSKVCAKKGQKTGGKMGGLILFLHVVQHLVIACHQ